MSIPALSVQDIGKKYQVGVQRSDTLRDRVASGFARLRRRGGGERPGEFWALRNVSFSVDRGEIVGVVGHNGAGKSTLLKILSRITKPTEGRVEIFGRVGSLLEVGTGFHPELTGRENIYLNGSILGMSRRDIHRKFDEIVEFAEVARFLETPVKRYSSGMYVRLAFAVAAHLEPEILLVDEVLAVGDAAFQRKCIGKMSEVSGEGRTVLFVSHNMAAVQALCTRGLLFRDGTLVQDADVERTVSAYLQYLEVAAGQELADRTDRIGKGRVRLMGLEVGGEHGGRAGLATGRPARFTFHISPPEQGISCTFTLYDQYGAPVVNFNSAWKHPQDGEPADAAKYLTCELEELLLVPGRYRMNVALSWNGELQDRVEGAAFIDVHPGTLRGRTVHADSKFGSVCMPHRWSGASLSGSAVAGSADKLAYASAAV